MPTRFTPVQIVRDLNDPPIENVFLSVKRTAEQTRIQNFLPLLRKMRVFVTSKSLVFDLHTDVVDRDDCSIIKPIVFRTMAAFVKGSPVPDFFLLKLRQALIDILTHEVDESLWFENARHYDQHRRPIEVVDVRTDEAEIG